MFGLRRYLDDIRRSLALILSNQQAIMAYVTGQSVRLDQLERRLQHVDDTTTTTKKSVADLDAVIAQLPAATADAVTAAVVPAIQQVIDPIVLALTQKNAQTADVDLSKEIATLRAFPGSLGTSLAQTLPGAIAANLQTSLGTSGSASAGDVGGSPGAALNDTGSSAATTDGAIVPGTTTGTEPTSTDAGSTPATPADGSATPSGGQ